MFLFSYIRRHSFIMSVVGILVLIVAILAGRAALKKPEDATVTTHSKVSLVKASTFRNGSVAVLADGVVESHSQADIKSQVSAPVTLVNVSVGASVRRGQTLLELSNSDIRAQLAQALSALAVAKGQQYTGTVSVESAKQGAIDKIRDAYVKTNDVINSQIDTILYNNDGNGGRLESFSSDNTLTNEIFFTDSSLKTTLPQWKTLAYSLTTSSSVDDITSAITYSQKNLNSADLLLGDMLKILSDSSRYAQPTLAASLATWKATVSAAHTTVSGAAQALTTAQTTLSTGNASQNTSTSASVAAAQAGVDNLQAQLAKTIITAPIAGKIAALPLRVGELASPGSLLATVVGSTSNLEIKSYVSGDDLSRIAPGQFVTMQNSIQGTVTTVAPSVDPTTKKAEVDIDINDSAQSGLVIGQNISVSIATTKGTTSADGSTTYTLPIQDVKIIPGDAFVYTVDENSKIKKNEVVLGNVQGDFVTITSGLTDDMNIVTPVYGLDEGQTVTVE